MTYRELFQTKCPELFEKIEANAREGVLDLEVERPTVGDALCSMFEFSETPEGFDFWAERAFGPLTGVLTGVDSDD